MTERRNKKTLDLGNDLIRMKLAFLHKNDKFSRIQMKINIQKIIDEVLELTQSKKIVINGIDAKMNYRINGNILSLEINTKKSLSSRELCNVYNKLTKGPHRKGFNIILVKDEASEYYIEKIVLLMNSFERLLRVDFYRSDMYPDGIDYHPWIIGQNIEGFHEAKSS